MTKYYILFYKTIDNFTEMRIPYREKHLELVRKYHRAGSLKMAGALDDPVDTAVLIFSDKEAADKFAENDPYVKNNLVKEWSVRPWNVVVGGD